MAARTTIFSLVMLASFVAVSAEDHDRFLLTRKRVGALAVGMSEESIYKVYARAQTRKVDLQLEGFPTPAVQEFVAPNKNTPALVIRLDNPDHSIYGIEVNDVRFQTAGGIHVGSTFGDLRRLKYKLDFASGEGVFAIPVLNCR